MRLQTKCDWSEFLEYPQLKHLFLTNANVHTVTTFDTFTNHPHIRSHLESLSMPRVFSLDDAGYEKLTRLTALEFLDLRSSPTLTKRTVLLLVTSLTRLCTLDVSLCAKVGFRQCRFVGTHAQLLQRVTQLASTP